MSHIKLQSVPNPFEESYDNVRSIPLTRITVEKIFFIITQGLVPDIVLVDTHTRYYLFVQDRDQGGIWFT